MFRIRKPVFRAGKMQGRAGKTGIWSTIGTLSLSMTSNMSVDKMAETIVPEKHAVEEKVVDSPPSELEGIVKDWDGEEATVKRK